MYRGLHPITITPAQGSKPPRPLESQDIPPAAWAFSNDRIKTKIAGRNERLKAYNADRIRIRAERNTKRMAVFKKFGFEKAGCALRHFILG